MHSALEALRLCAIKTTIDTDIGIDIIHCDITSYCIAGEMSVSVLLCSCTRHVSAAGIGV